jgi:hypothetical protein
MVKMKSHLIGETMVPRRRIELSSVAISSTRSLSEKAAGRPASGSSESPVADAELGRGGSPAVWSSPAGR